MCDCDLLKNAPHKCTIARKFQLLFAHKSQMLVFFDVGYTLQVIISFCEMLVCKRKMKKNCKIGMHANCGDDTRCLEHFDSLDKEYVKATSSESISLYH